MIGSWLLVQHNAKKWLHQSACALLGCNALMMRLVRQLQFFLFKVYRAMNLWQELIAFGVAFRLFEPQSNAVIQTRKVLFWYCNSNSKPLH